MRASRSGPLAAVTLGLLLAGAGCRGPAAHNVVLVTVDTLRADRLGFAGHGRDVSPALDRLAAESLVFERCYSQGGWTLPSIGSVLTGRYPGEHGATEVDRRLRRDLPTLAQMLSERGYSTYAFVSHVFLSADYGLAKGFDHYDDSVLEVGRPHVVSTAEPLTDRVLEVLAAAERPFFFWVHYFDPHFKYVRHREWGFGRRQIDRYDSEIAHTDRQIGRLLDALRERRLYDETIIVMTADHGEEFGEHGGRYHYGVDEVDLRVPLLVKAPGVEPRRIDEHTQQIDVFPTLLELLGIESESSLPGRSLISQRAAPIYVERLRPTPFRQRALISGDLKLVAVDVDETFAGDLERRMAVTRVRPGIRLFDLASDPQERNALMPDRDARAERMLELLERYAARSVAPGERVEVDDEMTEKLRSLGYLQ